VTRATFTHNNSQSLLTPCPFLLLKKRVFTFIVFSNLATFVMSQTAEEIEEDVLATATLCPDGK
jgi:hypothetical protein